MATEQVHGHFLGALVAAVFVPAVVALLTKSAFVALFSPGVVGVVGACCIYGESAASRIHARSWIIGSAAGFGCWLTIYIIGLYA